MLKFIFRNFLVVMFLSGCSVSQKQPDGQFTRIESAQLSTQSVRRTVPLPYQLQAGEYLPDGETVLFTLHIDLPAAPTESRPLGIYVTKMVLAGSVYVNGRLQARCGLGPLEVLRCMQDPHLFVPPPSMWKAGRNEVMFKIYADRRQSNGLSSVLFGDADLLASRVYAWQYLYRVDLYLGLAWLSGLLGVLSLMVSFALKKESGYLWFGLTSIANSLSSAIYSVVNPPVSAELFSWLVFVSRFISVPLLVLTIYAFFDKLRPRFRNTVLLYIAAGALLMSVSGNTRAVVIALYAPLLLVALLLPGLLSYWTWRNPKPRNLLMTLLMALLTVSSVADWIRLYGQAPFEGVYTIPYAYSGLLVAMGAMLMGLLARSLIESRELSAHLEARVAERTIALQAAHERLLIQEVEHNKALERERMLQDMHDGFGTQLASARKMTEQGRMTQEDMARILQECMSDLYLVVDTLHESDGSLRNALADFRHRTQQRLLNTGLKLHWDVRVSDAPKIPSRVMLQVLRIAQEALNNCLKHAKAQNIWIGAVYDPNAATLSVGVKDDGAGLPPELRMGRGIHNMRARARDIGGQLTVNTSPPGTLVALTLPIPSPAAQPARPAERPSNTSEYKAHELT